MNNYKKSNYAINKIRKGIVYRNADGSILEVTYEKIAAENPNFTAADFEKLKQLSDALYHEEEKSDNLQAHYVKASLDEFNSNICASTLSIEDELILKESECLFVEKFQKAIDTMLTPVQKKRLYLNCFRKMSIREIAKIEGTHYTVVAESIRRAKKKLKNYFINF